MFYKQDEGGTMRQLQYGNSWSPKHLKCHDLLEPVFLKLRDAAGYSLS